MYDSIVIGSGVAGSVIARTLAERGGQKVLVLERREHIGGNCYDRKDDHGILIHAYGPHIFHTDMEHVYEFFSKFTNWNFFGHKVVAKVADQLIPVPFNLKTLHMVYEEEKADRLEQKLIKAYGNDARVPIIQLRKSEDADIRRIADYVYENVFLHYTMKQWGQTPEEISPQVTGRVPILISYDDRYFQDKYQGMPENGYTPMFEKMLKHENITVNLQADGKEYLKIEEGRLVITANGNDEPFYGNVIYTGALDELFDCRYGRLPYRSLRFDFEHYKQEDYQGHSVVNYTVSEDYTRITEFKHLTRQADAKGTTIVKEYPFAYTGKAGEIPYYAIANEQNETLYHKYEALVSPLRQFYLLGRLAEYKYYNIDAMADKALKLAEQLINK
ncbi:UDP-galactopyranose mutase [Lachnospiraceae bacterium ZAX-1]